MMPRLEKAIEFFQSDKAMGISDEKYQEFGKAFLDLVDEYLFGEKITYSESYVAKAKAEALWSAAEAMAEEKGATVFEAFYKIKCDESIRNGDKWKEDWL